MAPVRSGHDALISTSTLLSVLITKSSLDIFACIALLFHPQIFVFFNLCISYTSETSSIVPIACGESCRGSSVVCWLFLGHWQNRRISGGSLEFSACLKAALVSVPTFENCIFPIRWCRRWDLLCSQLWWTSQSHGICQQECLWLFFRHQSQPFSRVKGHWFMPNLPDRWVQHTPIMKNLSAQHIVIH